MKALVRFLTLTLLVLMLTACANDKDDAGDTPDTGNNAGDTDNNAGDTDDTADDTDDTAGDTDDTAGDTDDTPDTGDATPDTVTTASIVDTSEAFEKAISNTGTWIIALTKDLTVDKEITLDGEFKNGKKDDAGNDQIQRKVALYAQDEERNITARYTLTAPKFTINSPEASIQHGTFKGDLYVNVENFKLVDATVDGNVFFTKEEYKTSFAMDETSKVTGKQEVQQ
ncbi:MAG: hypothetical protein K0S47_2978 [Herbinix sp.]|jgi:hypothetical protein|nr:hypothetical protein [Herbinix sp.]